MAKKPTVRWNEQKKRWMAWVRFPDGSRRKVERVDKADAQRDLDALITLRAQDLAPDAPRVRMATFADVIEAWFSAGCPNVAPPRTSRHARVKSPNTIANAHQLLGTSVLPKIGSLKVDRTTTRRLEELFESMIETHATSTIDRNWNYLNQALQHGVRNRTIKTNPAVDVLLPAKRPSKARKSFTVDQAHALLTEAIPVDPRPAMWLTGLMCGLRPGELVLGTDELYREAGYVAMSRAREANVLSIVGPTVDLDLTHAPTRDDREPDQLVRDPLNREGRKELAIESVQPTDSWRMHPDDWRRLFDEVEAARAAPDPPWPDYYIRLGLGL